MSLKSYRVEWNTKHILEQKSSSTEECKLIKINKVDVYSTKHFLAVLMVHVSTTCLTKEGYYQQIKEGSPFIGHMADVLICNKM